MSTALNEVDAGNIEIVADSAEPKSIVQLFDLEINVVSAVKCKDSILAGIHKVKEYNIKVTAKSRNGIRELKHYWLKMNSNGESLNEPIIMYYHFRSGIG